MPSRSLVVALALPLVALVAAPLHAKPRVEMELITEQGFPITGAQKWLKLLSDAGADGVQIRGSGTGQAPRTTQRGTAASPSYHVQGILTAGDQLVVEGASFTSREVGKIRAYFETLRSEGIAGPTEKKGAFGLTEKEMEPVLRDLMQPLEPSSRDKPPAELVEKIRFALQLPLSVGPEAAERLRAAEPVQEELRGLSLGTALAAIVRPSGLVLQPQKTASGVKLVVTLPAANGETWPVGWPPQQPDRDVLPVLFEFLTVEIAGIQLPEALSAMEERLETPILLDHNALARHGIEPEKVAVNVPEVRSYYKRVLDRLLFQARLKGELRVDEADKPFLWITTIKP